LPHIKSQWDEIQLQAVHSIGLLYHFGVRCSSDDNSEKYFLELEKTVNEKVIACLKDDRVTMKLRAVEALGYIFSPCT
jgi:hypothetical protein